MLVVPHSVAGLRLRRAGPQAYDPDEAGLRPGPRALGEVSGLPVARRRQSDRAAAGKRRSVFASGRLD
jgi:hypothetical protein